MRVAIAHDWLNQQGGAELVLEELMELWPDATIYTSFYDPAAMPPHYRQWDIRTSFMQLLPGLTHHHQRALPLYPLAFHGLDLSGYDLIISNSSGFAHLVRRPAGALHLNYCLTPPRFLWNLQTYVERESLNPLLQAAVTPAVGLLRQVDRRARDRVDAFAGISRAVVDRIRRVYGHEAELLYPPVHTARFAISDTVDDYYLVVSRLIPYKRVDLAVRAMTQLGRRLIVVGGGRDIDKLRAMAGPTVEFTGRLPLDAAVEYFQHCRAFLFPGEEDFGIAPLEAQAAGRPVIAYGAGGALDTVIDGETGVLFHEPTVASLVAAVERFEGLTFDPAVARTNALRFDTAVFHRAMRDWVARELAVARG